MEALRPVRWQGHGSLGFGSASTLVHDTYGATFDNAAPVVAGSLVSGPIDDDDDWNLGDIRFSSNADV